MLEALPQVLDFIAWCLCCNFLPALEWGMKVFVVHFILVWLCPVYSFRCFFFFSLFFSPRLVVFVQRRYERRGERSHISETGDRRPERGGGGVAASPGWRENGGRKKSSRLT